MSAMAVSAKRSSAFSIDSLIKSDRGDSLSSPKSCTSSSPPTSPQQVHQINAHLMNMKALYEQQCLSGGLDTLALGLNHPIFAGALPSSLPGHIPNIPAALNPALLLAGAQRESLFNPFLLARHPNLLHRFGKYRFYCACKYIYCSVISFKVLKALMVALIDLGANYYN